VRFASPLFSLLHISACYSNPSTVSPFLFPSNKQTIFSVSWAGLSSPAPPVELLGNMVLCLSFSPTTYGVDVWPLVHSFLAWRTTYSFQDAYLSCLLCSLYEPIWLLRFPFQHPVLTVKDFISLLPEPHSGPWSRRQLGSSPFLTRIPGEVLSFFLVRTLLFLCPSRNYTHHPSTYPLLMSPLPFDEPICLSLTSSLSVQFICKPPPFPLSCYRESFFLV